MEALLVGIFGQAYAAGGIVGAGAALGVFVLAAVLLKLAVTKIELMRQSADSADAERKEQLSILTRRAEAADQKLYTFITNHLEHDRAEREALGGILGKTEETLKAIAEDLRCHREEERGWSEAVVNKLTQVHIEVAKCPGRRRE